MGFYSLDSGEPPHIHVRRGGQQAKIWLQPVDVEWNKKFNSRELNNILDLVIEHQQELLEMWHEHFDQ